MTALRRPRVSHSVGWRLLAGLLPAVVAIGLVVGLFYYGEIGREAPRTILAAATALTALSLVVTWANARYFVDRIARLARVGGASDTAGDPHDEFDRVEHVVGTLGSALSAAESERLRADARAAEERRMEATMLAGAIADALTRLDQIRLPLHILLEAPFGALNENQEELLRDARGAADEIDATLRRLAQIADADRGAWVLQRELVQVNDVVRSVMPLARAAAERRGSRVELSLEPGLPRVRADRVRLAEALAILIVESAEASDAAHPLTVSTTRTPAGATIALAPVHAGSPTVGHAFGRRMIDAQGGRIASVDGRLEVQLGG